MSFEPNKTDNIFPLPINEEVRPVNSETGWYVLRYRILTQRLKNDLKNAPFEIFHKYKLQNAKAGNPSVRNEVPVLHGYVFVHAHLNDAKAYAQKHNLSMMLDPFYEFTPQDIHFKNNEIEKSQNPDNSQTKDKLEPPDAKRFVRINDKEMQTFMRAVELNAYSLKFYDPKVVDLHKDDLVEFIDGEYKGTRGYLKPGKGQNGGLVIVPLVLKRIHSDSDEEPHPYLANFCYSLEAHQKELGIIAFAKGNRHAKDCIIDSKPLVDAAFECFKKTGKVDGSTQEKLIAFVCRYGRARLNTNIQKAQYLSLLFRINTILRHQIIGCELRQKIVEVVIPGIERRKKEALRRGNRDAAKKHQLLLDEIATTDELFVAQSGINLERID